MFQPSSITSQYCGGGWKIKTSKGIDAAVVGGEVCSHLTTSSWVFCWEQLQSCTEVMIDSKLGERMSENYFKNIKNVANIGVASLQFSWQMKSWTCWSPGQKCCWLQVPGSHWASLLLASTPTKAGWVWWCFLGGGGCWWAAVMEGLHFDSREGDAFSRPCSCGKYKPAICGWFGHFRPKLRSHKGQKGAL